MGTRFEKLQKTALARAGRAFAVALSTCAGIAACAGETDEGAASASAAIEACDGSVPDVTTWGEVFAELRGRRFLSRDGESWLEFKNSAALSSSRRTGDPETYVPSTLWTVTLEPYRTYVVATNGSSRPSEARRAGVLVRLDRLPDSYDASDPSELTEWLLVSSSADHVELLPARPVGDRALHIGSYLDENPRGKRLWLRWTSRSCVTGE